VICLSDPPAQIKATPSGFRTAGCGWLLRRGEWDTTYCADQRALPTLDRVDADDLVARL
jgi:hypothetical protein